MPYQFSLRALLRIRRIYEQKERMHLTLLNASRNRVRREHDETLKQQAESFEVLEHRLEQGISGAEFGLEASSLQRMVAHRRELAAIIEALGLQVKKQTAIYRESQTKRKILDSLDERQRAEYQRIEDRREQQRIDDLFARRQRNGLNG
ncbi:MAG: flagellar FliJ family protein [Acidobacteriota bacterium]|nr:flagellar FliJ family protein [Acidobacteriota bacterium]